MANGHCKIYDYSNPVRVMLLIALLVIACTKVWGQNQRPWEKYLDELTEQDDNDAATSEQMFDILSELEENPIDINTATREDLSSIPFLSSQQIEDIEAYVYRYKGMKSMGELAMIESLDPIRRSLLPYFIYIGKTEQKPKFPKLKNIFKYGKNTLFATGRIPFYERSGDKTGKYIGPKYRHNIRYEFNYGKYVHFGIQGSQDAGEPFFAYKNGMGYDHYSYFLVIRELGRLKTLALGQYKLRLGMGLVMNNDFGFGKLMTLSTLGRSTNRIRANTSRSPANYMQGAAATVSIVKGLDVTGFFSYRPIDATLNKAGNIQTIVTDGYHRTTTEMGKKNNESQLSTGGNIHWQHGGFHLGATAIYSRLSKELQPNSTQSYRKYYPAGTNFWNASIDYGYINHRISINGETATGGSHGIATINTISFIVNSQLSLMALQRFYSKKYNSLFSSSFSDGGRIQNESGIYLGGNWQVWKDLSIMFYTDYAYFAQPRYQASRASHSWDNAVTATWTHNQWTILGRYRIRLRQKDNEKKTALADDETQRGRLSVSYGANKWSARLQGDVAYNSYKARSYGYMLSAAGSYNVWRMHLVADFGYFNTDDYASRIYSYERGPLYSFSFPAFYGEGIRYALFARADISKSLMLIAKIGTTDYFDRNHISSGNQQINHSSQTDLELQVRWKF